MGMFKQKIHNKGISLLETILALALGAVLLASVAMMGVLSLDSRALFNTRGDLSHQARIAVARISAELRYATKLLQAESALHSYLEFETTNLINTAPDVETIFFSRMSPNRYLSRQVDGGDPSYLAGISEFEGDVQVIAFDITPMKVDGSDNVVPLGADPLSEAVAVQFSLTLEDVASGETVTVSTMVKPRNL